MVAMRGSGEGGDRWPGGQPPGVGEIYKLACTLCKCPVTRVTIRSGSFPTVRAVVSRRVGRNLRRRHRVHRDIFGGLFLRSSRISGDAGVNAVGSRSTGWPEATAKRHNNGNPDCLLALPHALDRLALFRPEPGRAPPMRAQASAGTRLRTRHRRLPPLQLQHLQYLRFEFPRNLVLVVDAEYLPQLKNGVVVLALRDEVMRPLKILVLQPPAGGDTSPHAPPASPRVSRPAHRGPTAPSPLQLPGARDAAAIPECQLSARPSTSPVTASSSICSSWRSSASV